MDATKIGLGALLLAASGVTLDVAGQPGSGLALGLAGFATVTFVARALLGAGIENVPR